MSRVGAKLGAAAVLAVSLFGAAASWSATGEHVHIERQKWSFSGFFGKFDEAQLQRGFKVYTEACARCHSLKRIAFRNLTEPGGPHFSEGGVKTLGSKYEVDAEPNDQGKVVKRPATLVDRIPPPYKNDQEARAALNGALPPDLSLIARARGVETNAPFYMVPVNMLRDIATAYQEAGTDYVYAFLTGYVEPDKGTKVPDGMNYNKAFPSHFTAMPNPFAGGEGLVKYDDGSPEKVENYARDVAAFLSWTADPRLEDRKWIGMLVMGYLLITALLMLFAYKRTWKAVH